MSHEPQTTETEKPIPGSTSKDTDLQRGARQLRRLELMVDGVFALVIVLTVAELPYPSDESFTGASVSQFLNDHMDAYMAALISLVLVVIYWIQNNILFGNLSRTDDRHTTLSILQLFFLLFYFYTIGLGLDLNNPPDALALQSAAVTIVGLAALAAGPMPAVTAGAFFISLTRAIFYIINLPEQRMEYNRLLSI